MKNKSILDECSAVQCSVTCLLQAVFMREHQRPVPFLQEHAAVDGLLYVASLTQVRVGVTFHRIKNIL